MSHVVSIETRVRDIGALRAACRRLGVTEPVLETVQLFSGKATGYCVRLAGWRYPVACDVENGQLKFDNFQGRWGEQAQLDKLLQAYACEMTKIEARRKGHTCTEQHLADGSIKLTINAGGAA